MPYNIPRVSILLYWIICNHYRTILDKCTELRTSSRTSLKPKNQRYMWIWLNRIMPVSAKHIIEHSWLFLRVVPVYFLIASISKIYTWVGLIVNFWWFQCLLPKISCICKDRVKLPDKNKDRKKLKDHKFIVYLLLIDSYLLIL
jgi:hypothetical protein